MTTTVGGIALDCVGALPVALGATRVADREQFEFSWTLLHDPEGNEFDLVFAL